MKYCFIGAGNMAGAIIKGLTLGKNPIDSKNINTISKTNSSAKKLADECGINVCETYDDAISGCDVLVLGVKPNVLSEVAPLINDAVNRENPLIISIAVGKKLEYLESLFGSDKKIVRVMPNINAVVGSSVSGICGNKNTTKEDIDVVKNIFESIGSVIELTEDKFSIFGAIAGSSPAFAYLYIDSLARAGVKYGLTKKQALEIATHTVLGSAKMIAESDTHPWELIDRVCSPNGTTIEGISSLLKNGFESDVISCIDAVMEKDSKI